MRNLVMIPSDVMYPQKEQSYVLMGRDHAPFTNAMIGITYPYAAYQIHRGAGNRINLFELVLEGKGEVWIDGAWQAVEKGDMYIMVQDKWMDQIDATYKRIFTEEQWAAYLKQGAAKAQKARAKRKPKN